MSVPMPISTATRFIAIVSSLHLDVRVLDHLRPALDLGGDRLAKLVRRARDHFETARGEPLLVLWALEYPGDLARELVDDRLRRAARSENALPVAHLEIRHTRLAHRRHLRQLRRASFRGDGER